MERGKTTLARQLLDPNPWFLVAMGVGLLGAAWLLRERAEGLRIALLVVGSVFAYAGVLRRLRRVADDFPGRVESAAVVSVAGLGMFIAFDAADPDWSSVKVFFSAIFLLSLTGSLLLLLPRLPRRVALTLLILFHIGGIATAVTSVDPPGSTAPWIARQLMQRVYRPYLQFLYMTNAYHFYAPEPGMPARLHVAVHYSDGKYAWHVIANKADSPIGMDYQRLSALPQQSYVPSTRLPWTDEELRRFPGLEALRGSWEEIVQRRRIGSTYHYRPDDRQIPWVADLSESVQYQEPADVCKQSTSSIARHLFHVPALRRQGVEITSLKIYRVPIQPVTGYLLSKGVRPDDPTRWLPYFLGEFNRDGLLLHPYDPFLYWYLPIVRVPADYPARKDLSPNGVPLVRVNGEPIRGGFVLDCMEMHAATPSPQEK